MTRRRLRAVPLIATLFALCMSSCAKNDISTGYMLGSSFNAGDGAGRAAISATEGTAPSELGTEPAITIPETARETAAPTTATKTEPPAETSAGTGSIVFADLKESYSRGENVTLTIIGLPGTVYTLRIRYKSGWSEAKGLGEAESDARGVASWSFRIGSRVDGQTFSPYFEVSGDGETVIKHFGVTN